MFTEQCLQSKLSCCIIITVKNDSFSICGVCVWSATINSTTRKFTYCWYCTVLCLISRPFSHHWRHTLLAERVWGRGYLIDYSARNDNRTLRRVMHCAFHGVYILLFISCSCYTVSQTKVPTFKLSVTLSNLNRFSNFWLPKRMWNLLQNPYNITHLTLAMLLHYLGKSKKIKFFCKYLERRFGPLVILHFVFSVFIVSTSGIYTTRDKITIITIIIIITCSWWFDIDRHEAETLLMFPGHARGTFLVRPSRGQLVTQSSC